MLLRYVPLLPDKTVKGVFSVKSLALCFAPTAACGKSQITNNRQPETAGIGVLFCVVLLLFCGDSPALCLFADFGEFIIKAFFLYQLIMRAALGNLTVINNQNLGRVLNCSKPVRYGDNRFAARQLRDGLLNEMFVFGVYARRCLIENDNRCIFKYRTCNGYALLFAARKRSAALARRGVVSKRQLIDEFFALCGLCGGSKFSILSTIIFFISPIEWFSTLPKGACRNLSARRRRRLSKTVYAML